MAGEVAKRRLDAGALQRAQRDAEVCALRARGWEFRDIEDHLGMGRGSAQPAMRRALVETMRAPADELRGVELTLINAGIRECWNIISAPQPLLDKSGKAVTLEGEDGIEYAVADQSVIVAALTVMNKFSESRRKLMGEDAPQRSITAKANVTLQDLQEMAIASGVPAAEVYQLPPSDDHAG